MINALGYYPKLALALSYDPDNVLSTSLIYCSAFIQFSHYMLDLCKQILQKALITKSGLDPCFKCLHYSQESEVSSTTGFPNGSELCRFIERIAL